VIEVLVFGHWDNATRVASAVGSRSEAIRAAFVPQGDYVRLLARPPRSERVILIRAGYRVGSSTTRGRLFDAFWSLLRRRIPAAVAVHYWLGTDVLDTLEEASVGTLRRDILSAARGDLHLAVAPWLASELATVGLEATFALLPPPVAGPAHVPPLPEDFSVLTYLPAIRFDFYGGPTILEAARRLPTVRFDVVGAPGEAPRTATDNIRWHGWVEDMPQRYADTTVVARIPRHDGFGNTIIEGLLFGRHCLYTEEVPFVHTVSPATPDTVVHVLGELHAVHAAGSLGPNLGGREYALQAFDQAGLEERLAALVRSRL
jgi:hypothetical protein